MRILLLISLAFVSVMAAVAVVARAASEITGGFDLAWHTIDSGGGTSTGGTFSLSGTIAQPDASTVALTAGTFQLVGGFWAGAGPMPFPTCPADIAPPGGDGLVNVTDLLTVINGWGACGVPCPPHCTADVNHDCAVNVSDLLAVINAWGVCH